MSIRDDHDDVDRIQLTPPSDDGRTCYFGRNVRVDEKRTEFGGEELLENPLVVKCSSTLETQGESPTKCMYHLMSPTVPAETPVDPRFSSEKPPRVRMILPEFHRGTSIIIFVVYLYFVFQCFVSSSKTV